MLARISTCLLLLCTTCLATDNGLQNSLETAGDNATEIERALSDAPADQREGMEFLVRYMPARDLKTLKADFLLRNVDLAYQTRKSSAWQIPDDIFLNDVLPYASINERRDDFRQQFHDRFAELVKDAKSPGEAAAILNNRIFKELNVKYSRQRRRADQGPFESIESGLASCTGLSILLIDACRSVGVPARFAGTPLWSDRSGNHSWVEVWDDGWHFTGAAEPTGMDLDQSWFIGRSSKAQRDNPLHAIYAVSYRKTPVHFPLVWDRSIKYVNAVNVTDRYADKAKDLPPNHTYAMFKAYGIGGNRCCTPFTIRDDEGNVVFEGITKDESFDGNDHTTVPLPIGASFELVFGTGAKQTITTRATESNSQLFAFAVDGSAAAPNAASKDGAERGEPTSTNTAQPTPVDLLSAYLASDAFDWNQLAQQSFANEPLNRVEASNAKDLLVQKRREQLMADRKAEVEVKEIQLGDHSMPFSYKVFGDKPEGGRSLYISMHGGGNAPARVNDRQWNNQKRLYEPAEGVYLAPRAPTNTWNLWHEGHIMPMFDRLIEDMVLFEDVNPNRVYIMGYSAGGDGVYQLAPRMADRLAAAAMMAGHPNDAQPLNLRNIGFALYMGGKDKAYKRNEVAAEWGQKLAKLQQQDPEGYRHLVTIYPDKGHWMDGQDASSLPWMAEFRRNLLSPKVVWRKDGNPQPRFYWLGADTDHWTAGESITATLSGQEIRFGKLADNPPGLRVFLNDAMLDLDRPVTIHWPADDSTVNANSDTNANGQGITIRRTIAAMHECLTQRFDPTCVFTAVARP